MSESEKADYHRMSGKMGSNYMRWFIHSEYSFPYLFIGNLHSGMLSNIQVSNGYSCQKVQFKSALRMPGWGAGRMTYQASYWLQLKTTIKTFTKSADLTRV